MNLMKNNVLNKINKCLFPKNIKYNFHNLTISNLSVKNKIFLYYTENKKFCNLLRINFDKLNIGKENQEKTSTDKNFQIIKDENDLKEKETQANFEIEENILEFNNTTNWEEDVLKSEIPVVVDCYAEYLILF